jgi:hypothetical protein
MSDYMITIVKTTRHGDRNVRSFVAHGATVVDNTG